MEEQRVNDKIELIEEEQEEKKQIDEEYLRKLFKKDPDAERDAPEQKQAKLDLLNEYLSDQSLERLSGLLTK